MLKYFMVKNAINIIAEHFVQYVVGSGWFSNQVVAADYEYNKTQENSSTC
jgi:hypothetical protein